MGLKRINASICGVLMIGCVSGCLQSNPQDRYERSVEAIARGNYEQGIAGLNRTIEAQPEFAEAYVNRGIAYAESGKVAEAIADYQQALELNPDLIDAHYNLGNVHMQAKNYDQAIAAYSEVITRNSSHGAAFGNRGNAYEQTGQLDKAIEDIETAAILFATQGNIQAKSIARLKLEKLKQLD